MLNFDNTVHMRAATVMKKYHYSNADNFFNAVRPQVRLFKDAQIPDARSQWRQNFVRWRLNVLSIRRHSGA